MVRLQNNRWTWTSLLIGLVVILNAMTGCNVQEVEDPLEANMRKAGKNRKELIKVLNHYQEDPDTLKYQAAEFLILNMDAHYSSTNRITKWKIQSLTETVGMTGREATQYLDSARATYVSRIWHKNQAINPDLKAITAQYLINNIDSAFIVWRAAPWQDDIDFETFCNYVLPYKSGNAPLQRWRNEYNEAYRSIVESARQPNEMVLIADTLLTETRSKFRWINKLGQTADFGANDLLKTKAGQCYQWAHSATTILRTFAVPTGVLYTPQWADHPAGHAWNGIIDSGGQVLSYSAGGRGASIFNPLTWPLKTAKVYLVPYGKNPLSFAMQPGIRSKKDIPEYLLNPCMLDVTGQLVPATDVPVTVQSPTRNQEEFMFLCVFSRGAYNAIHWSHVDAGEANFTDMGNDALYLPVFYRAGKYFPAADPVIVSYDGEVSSVVLDTSSWQTLRVYRKYPIRGSMFRYTRPFKGMKIQKSEKPEFEEPEDVYEISRFPSPVITERVRQRARWNWEEYMDSVTFDQPVTTRYLRFLAAPNTECIVGEIECFDVSGEKLKGEAFGSIEGAENVQDGLYGEAFHDPDSLGWVAIDFGEEVSVSRIRYLPSNDSNSIQVGDRYELLYWDNGWISLGEQVAAHKSLDYRAPANALFWLRNLDRGIEERVFTIDPPVGKQVWW